MIGLIADDLTGASDAGVQFARRGLASRVLFDLSDRHHARGVDVLAVDTETRAAPPAEAYARVRQVAEALRQIGPDHVYKKVDSTLRGNLGPEIDAVMDAFDAALAIVAPAFPALGRTTRGGVHLLRGVPVHQTEIGRDPKAPVHESHLVRLLERASHRPVGLIGAETFGQGPEAIKAAAERLAKRGVSLLVCDVEADADLHAIAASLIGRTDVLWVGSAGLAESLADALGLHGSRRPAAELDGRIGGPILLVAGSLSETTRQQVAALERQRRIAHVELDPSHLFRGSDACEQELRRCREDLRRALAAGQDAALVAGARSADPDTTDRERAGRIAEVLGTLAADCVRGGRLGGLVLTGGDTARAVCGHLGITGIQLLAEVEPGVSLGVLVGDPSARLLAVTKAGAFGSERTLVHALDRLKGDR